MTRRDNGPAPWIALVLMLLFVLYAGLHTPGEPLPAAPASYLEGVR